MGVVHDICINKRHKLLKSSSQMSVYCYALIRIAIRIEITLIKSCLSTFIFESVQQHMKFLQKLKLQIPCKLCTSM